MRSSRDSQSISLALMDRLLFTLGKNMKIIITLIFTLMLVACASNQKVNEPPVVAFNPPWNWHECLRCESLDGGCYPKNTISSHRTDKGQKCIHQWKRITKKDFNQKWREKTGDDRSPNPDFELFGTKPQPVVSRQ